MSLASRLQLIFLGLFYFLSFNVVSFADYSTHPAAGAFIKQAVSEYGLSKESVISALKHAKKQESIIKAISRPAEKVLTWSEYRSIFINPKRINSGLAFMREHADLLEAAEKKYGVPSFVIAAIIGVETYYGKIKGSHTVMDALSTLAFDYPPRSAFFRGELLHFLKLANEEKLDIATLKGSYAGAMGYGQFIPSSYRHYAVDFNGDGQRDLVNSVEDAIGSVANYLAKHKWRDGEPVLLEFDRSTKANQPDSKIHFNSLKKRYTLSQLEQMGFSLTNKPDYLGEIVNEKAISDKEKFVLIKVNHDDRLYYMGGFHNFYVITRYNHSHLYALAVSELAAKMLENFVEVE